MADKKRKCSHCQHEFSDQNSDECPSCGEKV